MVDKLNLVIFLILNNRIRPIRQQQGFLYNPPTTLQPIYESLSNGKFKPPSHLDSQIRLIPTKTRTKYLKSQPPRSFTPKVI